MKWTKPEHYRINVQITGMIFLCLAFVFMLIWMMNNLFLKEFYLNYKTASMEDAFEKLNAQSKSGNLYEESFSDELEKICANENVSIVVMSSDGSVALQSESESQAMMRQLFDLMLGRNNDASQLIISNDNYTIQKSTDDWNDNEYLTLWGTLDDGNLILIRSAIQSMTDAAELSNRLLIYIGVLSLFIGMIFSFAIVKHITRPLHEMTELSRHMTELDFDARYVPRKHMNELDLLGLRMNELSDALESTIRELKQANTQLERDIDIRDKNESMRRDFISSVSHELKTPLALIRGYTEGLSENIAGSEEDRAFYLEVIIDETEKMNRIVQQLLSLNRLEYGEGQVNMERLDLLELVRSVVRSYSVIAREKEIKISLIHDSDTVNIWSDASMCEQVADNYLSNAIHYAAGDKQIEVRLEDKDDVVRLGVFNTGDPIDQEAMPHLWEKFYKADQARTREYGGTGIGLSIVYAIAEALHTECGAQNYENGVLFWFEFEK